MLTPEENRRYAQTGPETPMGQWFRQYWLPICLSEELAPGGAPVALTILGQELVAVRDPEGRLGLMDRYCPHRGVSLAYGRNELGGLRCIYHGWKIGMDGRVLETPNAQTTPRFRQSIEHGSYRLEEGHGLVWAFLGAPGAAPPRPWWAWMDVPPDDRVIVKIRVAANYFQVLEGGVDTSHLDFLHRSDVQLAAASTDPVLQMEDTAYGFRYAGIREGQDPSHKSVRVTHFVYPSQVFVSIGPPGSGLSLHHFVVPMTDTECYVFDIRFVPGGREVPEALKRYRLGYDRFLQELELDQDFRPRRRRANGHLQDRALMAEGHWCGIIGVRSQDLAVVESAPAIIDRGQEHLVAADAAVTHLRQSLARAVQLWRSGEGVLGRLPSNAYQPILPRFEIVSEAVIGASGYW